MSGRHLGFPENASTGLPQVQTLQQTLPILNKLLWLTRASSGGNCSEREGGQTHMLRQIKLELAACLGSQASVKGLLTGKWIFQVQTFSRMCRNTSDVNHLMSGLCQSPRRYAIMPSGWVITCYNCLINQNHSLTTTNDHPDFRLIQVVWGKIKLQ